MFLLAIVCSVTNAPAQSGYKSIKRTDLPDIRRFVTATQSNAGIYRQNLNSHSQEHDVNSIVKEMEGYIDSLPKNKSNADLLLIRQFSPLRHFFLTTANKTTVAPSFLYAVTPYQFCSYNDTALVLYISALEDGEIYNLGKTTEKKVISKVLDQCLLPSLKALDDFKTDEVKYIGISVYYGCKDTRDGAPKEPVTPYCITMVARLEQLQQYTAGLITGKGLMANADIYLSDEQSAGELNRIRVNGE